MNKDLVAWLIFVTVIGIVFAIGLTRSEEYHVEMRRIELKALQAQVDKKYCEGEVTYPELREELRK